MTTAINRKVLDISHHNEVTSYEEVKAAGIVGIIHKATEGGDYVDDAYAGQRERALTAGLLWGAYHFATGSAVEAQAEHFLSVVGHDESTLYCLDWEDYGDNTMSLAQAREFLEFMGAQIGPFRCVLYAGNTAKEELGDTPDGFFGTHRLWLAQYGTSPVVQASWESEWLWQYSDGEVGPEPHGCSGVTGYVDTNSWAGTDRELREQWSGLQRRREPTLSPRPTFGDSGPERLRPRWDARPGLR